MSIIAKILSVVGVQSLGPPLLLRDGGLVELAPASHCLRLGAPHASSHNAG